MRACPIYRRPLRERDLFLRPRDLERSFFFLSERAGDLPFFGERDLDFFFAGERDRDFFFAGERERDFLLAGERDFLSTDRFLETEREAEDFRAVFFFFGGDREREELLEAAFFLLFFSAFFLFGDAELEFFLRRSFDLDLGLERPRFVSSLRRPLPPPPPEGDLDALRPLSRDLERAPRFFSPPRSPPRERERFFLAADRDRERCFLGAGEESGRRRRSPDLLL